MKVSFLIALMAALLVTCALMAPIYYFKWRPLEEKMERVDIRTGFIEECYRADLRAKNEEKRPYLIREFYGKGGK
jgi:hypothetical protein